ncbi:5-(carboxyamino)imidazole ribonucleotide synthase [Parvularcula sp. LCG005]|uniref:5-(carboxyamino)imidazole ribonucleotide synthase n=1 Tax=Parvularcula sp. LCG005 TaxID=3078805 RepID=UPI002942E4DE|nr:5-(carboxyamino)imidazole ribonucleotide synthase [Parvularcula sp. LCG005]WOI53955.1 5-(carboxyamino)imidazole ribonucleotide synthase [Parvularcula sp. LCG005]
MSPLDPGATIGIVGTGQLGRMLAVAAAKLGFRVHTFGPEADPPAARVADAHIAAAYDDEASLRAFAAQVDAATYEFENIPPETVRILQDAGIPVRPGARILAVCQDRIAEKTFLRECGLTTAPFHAVDDLASLEAAARSLGGRGILKTRRFGYDGKGQARISAETDLAAAYEHCGQSPCVLEGFVDFDCEVSQVAARGVDGDMAFYDLPRNEHADGILRRSIVPAGVGTDIEAQARDLTAKVMEALDYVGVLAVEYFVHPDEGLIANEIAPRVHNTGHWTHEACMVGQFEQHIRAVAAWPLGNPARHSNAIMTNLIGAEANDWLRLTVQADLSVTLYGKAEARPGRKMGHTVALSERSDS